MREGKVLAGKLYAKHQNPATATMCMNIFAELDVEAQVKDSAKNGWDE